MYNPPPIFAALTFPIVIAVVASFRTGKYIESLRYETVSMIISFITQANLLLATTFISYILLNWFHLWIPEYSSQTN